MAKKKWETHAQAQGDRKDQLLEDLGLEEMGEEIELYAEMACEKGARATTSLKELVAISGKHRRERERRFKPPAKDEVCPLCGRHPLLEKGLSMDEMKATLETLRELRDLKRELTGESGGWESEATL